MRRPVLFVLVADPCVPIESESGSMNGPQSAFTLMAGLVRPESRGSVRLTGPGADDPIAIDLNVFDEGVLPASRQPPAATQCTPSQFRRCIPLTW